MATCPPALPQLGSGTNKSADDSDIVHDSMPEYDVLSVSPSIGLLADSGDAFDGLAVRVPSVQTESPMAPVVSMSLRADIERLTTENQVLKRDAIGNLQTMKTYLERCNAWREQMQKCHDRDAMMMEEARLTTLKLKQEVETLHACLANAQKKLEEAVVEKFNISEAKKSQEKELAKVRAELAEVYQKLDETSFENICAEDIKMCGSENKSEGGNESLSQKAVEACKSTEVGAESEAKPVGAAAPEESEEIKTLRKEIIGLRKQLEDLNKIEAAHKVQTQELQQLQAAFSEKMIQLREVQDELSNLQKTHQTYQEQMEKAHRDLQEQRFTDKTDTDQEKKVQELNRNVAALEMKIQQSQKEAEALKKDKADFVARSAKHEMELTELLKKLTNTEGEVAKLSGQMQRIREERDALEEACGQYKTLAGELAELKEREAVNQLLLRDQASQVEAFKEEWRQEQADRIKWEKNYNDLLQTWQNFEERQPVIVQGESTQQDQVSQAALDTANAERVRLERRVESLEREIADLQAQNVQLMNDRLFNAPQQAGRSRFSEFRCPLCNKAFSDSAVLIQHAGDCEGINTQ